MPLCHPELVSGSPNGTHLLFSNTTAKDVSPEQIRVEIPYNIKKSCFSLCKTKTASIKKIILLFQKQIAFFY